MSASRHTMALNFADVIMRVPPLFIIDELLRIGLDLPTGETVTLKNTEHRFIGMDAPDTIVDSFVSVSSEPFLMQLFNFNQYFYQTYLLMILKLSACCIGSAAALCAFMLWTKHLIIVYLYLISIVVIFISYWSNVSTMKAIILYGSSHETATSILDDILGLNFTQVMNYGPGLVVVENYILQCMLASIFCYVHLAPRYAIIQKLLVVSFMAPSILGIHPLPTSVLYHAPVFATLLPLAVSKFVIWYNGVTMLKTIYLGYQHARNFISNYGLSALAETEWSRLNVPLVFRTFWMLRLGEQVIQILGTHYGEETFTYYDMIKTLLVNGCETLIAVLGMTSIVSLICHYIGCFFQWVLLTEDGEKSIGTVSAILFYILALQTGLTGLDREKRLVRLCRNFCLLCTAVLHFVHNIVNPLLMSLSASHNPALHRHIRALSVCAFLILFPVSLLVFLWSQSTVSTWLLAVSVFSIEVIVKVLVSLAIYSLFLFDAYRSAFWEQLDDYVYYIRSFGNTVDFAFGIFLFFNGFWILVFESGGAIRAFMMCIHAYFNIWCEAKAGWSVFMKRRTAVNKINSLPEAKVDQLRSLDDVCAICYQEMQNAKITRCNHYFHSVCLRKWLYVQDRCPLCHDILYKVENPNANKDSVASGTEQERSNEENPLLPGQNDDARQNREIQPNRLDSPNYMQYAEQLNDDR
ncbi:protein TRC8 homolog [Cephus cinctus]|uniref:Protein TRC8 homolog n=1 Tax=Cephus cinctus TaxID=211228 RepID=A0AAJ7BXY7_CEPCN|nr:protein TRC8 homolog [Cephus cinctus]XP_015597177.1 protein TRC8 homolog [Cephus cinctus]XP_024941688.1 protein TRC8 homolog [Cephus cinctus]